MIPKTRKHVYLPDELDARLKELSITLGVSFNSIVTMALQAGIASISIATNPELKPYFENELKKQGVKDAKTNRSKSAE